MDPTGSPFTHTPMSAPQSPAALNPSQLAGLISAIQNLVIGQSLLITTINNKWPNWVEVPVNSASNGVAGQVAYEAGFFYVCVASNHWQRVAIANF